MDSPLLLLWLLLVPRSWAGRGQIEEEDDDGRARYTLLLHGVCMPGRQWWHQAKRLFQNCSIWVNEVVGSGFCGARKAPEPSLVRPRLWDAIDDIHGLTAQGDRT